MTVADRKPVAPLDPQYLITAEIVERPAAERPTHETIDTILAWLADPVRHMPLLINGFDEFAWRLLAAGFPLLRTTLHVRTLHVQSPLVLLRIRTSIARLRSETRRETFSPGRGRRMSTSRSSNTFRSRNDFAVS